MTDVFDFTSEICVDRAYAGGKGANLAVLTRAGFPVPPGFVIGADAYRSIIHSNALAECLSGELDAVNASDVGGLVAAADRIRGLILGAKIPPALAESVLAAYGALGHEAFVAVRSSGTAEDLAEASFAGQHDTYLDVRGTEEVLSAVKACWASLWTSRAIAYRESHGFDHLAVSLAVVVQVMVEAEVAGVMFTANPLTTATDEIVVNASWGLGESVVSGIVSPDQYVLDKKTLRVKETLIGAKERRILRDSARGRGTITEDVPASERSMLTLDAARLAELGALGLRVERHYGGLPQDIEWACRNDRVYLLQARDITGAHFTWDEDVDAWQWLEDRDDVLWTRSFADEYWTGAVTPLFYSIRAREFTDSHERVSRLWGFDDLASLQRHRYYKGEVYFSLANHKLVTQYVVPKAFRTHQSLEYFPPSTRAEMAELPFSRVRYLRMHARIFRYGRNEGFNRWIDVINDYMQNRTDEADGLSLAELRQLSDAALMEYIQERVRFATGVLYGMWTGFFVHGAAALNLLRILLDRWYDGGNTMIYADLITGLPERTVTLQENLALWDLAREISSSRALVELFHSSTDETFFLLLAEHPEGARAADMYARLVSEHGHRGHADRDFYYDRRAENPALDYRAVGVLLKGDLGPRPDEIEERLTRTREAATADVADRLRRKPLGRLRVFLFASLLGYVHRFLVLRDNERHYVDRFTFAKKRAFIELGRRLAERGVLRGERDFYFLTKDELYEALDRGRATPLLLAKVEGRRRQFLRMDVKEYTPPLYLRANSEVEKSVENDPGFDESGALVGLPVSRGYVTGTARVVLELKDIGRIQKGDILVTNSTDPGWTPVFAAISGLILETGGVLAHGSCLSREYGLPAVTIPNAARLIEDGAEVSIDGTSGRVVVAERDASLAEAVNLS